MRTLKGPRQHVKLLRYSKLTYVMTFGNVSISGGLLEVLVVEVIMCELCGEQAVPTSLVIPLQTPLSLKRKYTALTSVLCVYLAVIVTNMP